MDAQTINETVSIIDHLPELKKSGRYHIGPCPFCGGVDRFNVKETDSGQLWVCRQCGNGRYQDAVSFLMKRDGLTFSQLLAAYGGEARPARTAAPPKAKAPPATDKPPGEEWQAAAMAALADCCNLLASGEQGAARAWRYLRGRGLLPETIRGASLGWNPKWREVLPGQWLAPGVTIPGMAAGQLWYVQTRTTQAAREAAEKKGRKLDKYSALTGSKLRALFGADKLLAAETAVITEGELDALLLGQFLPQGWAAVTMGSAGSLPDNAAWLRYFAAVKRAYLVLDNDQAGQTGVSKWRKLLPWVELLPVPGGQKDITNFWQAGGDMAAWLESVGCKTAVSDAAERLPTITLVTMPQVNEFYSWGREAYCLESLEERGEGWIGTFAEHGGERRFTAKIARYGV